jgi:hypothetical protein
MTKAKARPNVLTRARELRARQYTVAAIAEVLNAEQYQTARGGAWAKSQVWSMLRCPKPNVASLAPCTECGFPTSSKYGICHDAACRNAYQSKWHESRKPEDTRKSCTSCGQLTYSALDVCARPSCINAYARATRAASGGAPSLYAVWFPTPSILKVGFTKHSSSSRIAGFTRSRAKKRGWDTEGSSCFWQRPGDNRAEAWIQATLSFRWRSPFHASDGRLCEWFTVYHLTVEEITEVLDCTYQLVPPDLTGRALV